MPRPAWGREESRASQARAEAWEEAAQAVMRQSTAARAARALESARALGHRGRAVPRGSAPVASREQPPSTPLEAAHSAEPRRLRARAPLRMAKTQTVARAPRQALSSRTRLRRARCSDSLSLRAFAVGAAETLAAAVAAAAASKSDENATISLRVNGALHHLTRPARIRRDVL